jgi:polar amino acid transport system substrate-binding protein
MQPTDPDVADLIRSGRFRIALFLPQYDKDPASGALRGVGMGYLGIEIGRALAARLEVEMVVVALATPANAVEGLKAGTCDAAFLGIDPSRAAEVALSPPIIQFDFTCLVPPGSSLRSFGDVEQSGRRIAVVRNHASTMTLRRIARHAALVDVELPDQAFELLRSGAVDAFAAPRGHLLDYSSELFGSRVLADGYGINRVAMALPKGRAGWLAYVVKFIDEIKASGLVQRAIDRGGLRGFQVVPTAMAD